MKLAKILPIFKSGSRSDVNNYRPISLLSVFSKILEKLMHNRLYSFLEQNNVIYNSQFGFQKNKSTEHSLIEIVEKVRNCTENRNYGCGIFTGPRTTKKKADAKLAKYGKIMRRPISCLSNICRMERA